MESNDSVGETTALIRRFVADRQWERFHTPKNLAVAISVEAGELLEIFQWLLDGERAELGEDKLKQVELELGDVLILALRLADTLNIDPLAAVRKKVEVNAAKYPVHLARGIARKYDKL